MKLGRGHTVEWFRSLAEDIHNHGSFHSSKMIGEIKKERGCEMEIKACNIDGIDCILESKYLLPATHDDDD